MCAGGARKGSAPWCVAREGRVPGEPRLRVATVVADGGHLADGDGGTARRRRARNRSSRATPCASNASMMKKPAEL